MPCLRDQTDRILAELLAGLRREAPNAADPAGVAHDLQIHLTAAQLLGVERARGDGLFLGTRLVPGDGRALCQATPGTDPLATPRTDPAPFGCLG
jgi:hypothetical protein